MTERKNEELVNGGRMEATAGTDGWASYAYRGEMREMGTGVLFGGSSFRILGMKRVE